MLLIVRECCRNCHTFYGIGNLAQKPHIQLYSVYQYCLVSCGMLGTEVHIVSIYILVVVWCALFYCLFLCFFFVKHPNVVNACLDDNASGVFVHLFCFIYVRCVILYCMWDVALTVLHCQKEKNLKKWQQSIQFQCFGEILQSNQHFNRPKLTVLTGHQHLLF